ncbi:MAG: class I SAM-dependent methyltransferase [Phenylobacterium sp.]|uniref:SAM-dependent methyltransferase n=1 Tax=Phenylobacterium sp. TaxID=1871053 RepID=UPI001A491DCF|nr:methyltransferase domain-containing protein [Phenylobacterium sp.]MBL8772660.1 class I SAM-dependent methyltransferase [Phenylobacterium sp.]
MLVAALAALVLAACQSVPSDRGIDVIYVPTPESTVSAMLELGEVRAGDVVYDLGSGDGRIPIEAARRFGARGLGVELSAERVREARANARAAGVGHLVEFRRQDLFATDLSEATVVTLYLLPDLNLRLRPKLLALKPGTRIVSHAWDMGDWRPEATREMADGSEIYLWRVPERPTP